MSIPKRPIDGLAIPKLSIHQLGIYRQQSADLVGVTVGDVFGVAFGLSLFIGRRFDKPILKALGGQSWGAGSVWSKYATELRESDGSTS